MRFSWIFLLLALPAGAAEWPVRDSDQKFDAQTLEVRVRGQVLTFFDDGQSRFYDDGRYQYTYANDGGSGYGYFTIRDDSTVCIEFVNGFERCDLYVLDGQGRLVVITEKGERFPVRP